MNKSSYAAKVRADPMTGLVDCIPVSGDFRSSHNLIGAITIDKKSILPMVYHISKSNNTAKQFMSFMRALILDGWFRHLDVLVLDNAAVHTGGEAEFLVDMLWNYEIDGEPLRVLVVYLPTRSPELNPIECIFNTLSLRVRQYRTRSGEGPTSDAVVHYAKIVMDNFSFHDIKQVYRKCGYTT